MLKATKCINLPVLITNNYEVLTMGKSLHWVFYIALYCSLKEIQIMFKKNWKFKFLWRKLMGLGCNYASETSIPRIAEPGSYGSNFSTIPTSVWLEMHCSTGERGWSLSQQTLQVLQSKWVMGNALQPIKYLDEIQQTLKSELAVNHA